MKLSQVGIIRWQTKTTDFDHCYESGVGEEHRGGGGGIWWGDGTSHEAVIHIIYIFCILTYT